MFLVKDLRASRVNLMMNDYAAGLPSPLAFLGLADTLMRALGLEPWAAGCLPILHEVSVSDGRTKPEMEPKGAVFQPIETIEDMVGTVAVSLVLDLPGAEDEIAVARELVGRRIAGGTIANEMIRVLPIAGDGAALRQLPRGWAVMPARRAGRRVTSAGSQESLMRVAAALNPSERGPGFGWPVPVAVGYRLLEDPDRAPKRSGTRSRTVPHVFAEPLLGIAELVSVRSRAMTSMGETELRQALWRWHAAGDVLAGHENYHPHTALPTEDETSYGQEQD